MRARPDAWWCLLTRCGLAVLLSVVLAIPRLAFAQTDVTPPTVQIPDGVSQTATIPLVIAWCDDQTLNPLTLTITVNGVDVRSYFSYATPAGPCGEDATSTATALPLSWGVNTIVATIEDHAGNVGSSVAEWVYGSGFVDVLPKGVTLSRAQQATLSETFQVHNRGNVTTTFKLAATCTNAVSGCTVTDTVRVLPDSTANVSVAYTTGSKATFASGQLRLRARVLADSTAADSGALTITLQNSLIVDLSANNTDAQDMRRCAFTCFANIQVIPTVGYASLGQSRGLALVHNSARMYLRPYVQADVSFEAGPAAPTRVTLAVQDSVTGSAVRVLGADNNGYGVVHYSVAAASGGKIVRLGTVISDDTWLRAHGTGVHPLRLIFATYRTGYTEVDTTYLPLLIVRNVPGRIARGWYVDGIQRLMKLSNGRRLIVEADGSAFLYTASGGASTYVSPTGDDSRLERTGSEQYGTYVRSYADSTKVHFDSLGLMTKVTDAWGVSIRYAYTDSTSGSPWRRPSRVYDPYRTRPDSTAAPSAYTEIAYVDTSIYIRPPKPDGSSYDNARVTTLRLNRADSSLIDVIDPDSGSTRFTYRKLPYPDHNINGQLNEVYDRNGVLARQFDYDEAAPSQGVGAYDLRRVKLATIPVAVGNSGGTSNSQPEQYLIDWRKTGVPTGGTSSASLQSAPQRDTLHGRVTNFRNTNTYLRGDRWGQLLQSVSEGYTADEAQSPYASKDTIRVFRTGVLVDSIRYPSHAVDRFGYAGSGAGARLDWSKAEGGDSLSYLYDSFGQLLQVAGALTPTQSFYRSGNPLKLDSVSTGGLTTRVRYDAFGRDTSITDPGSHTTRKTYDAVFGHLNRTELPGNRYTAVTFDGYGRDSILTDDTGRSRHLRYDGIDRVTRDSIGGDGRPTTYAYNKEFPVSVTDPKAQVFRRAVNALGWTTAVYDAADTTKTTTYRYTPNGLLASWTNRRGQRTEIDYDVLDRPRWSTNTGGFAADSMNYGFRYASYPKTLNVSPRNGEFVVWRNRNATDSVWMDLTGWVDSVVKRVVDGRSGGLGAGLAQKRLVRRYAKNALNQPTAMTADLRQVSNGSVLAALTARGYQYDAARVLTSLSVGSDTVAIARDGERQPELWTYPDFQRATAYSARHEDANSYYDVPGLQALYGRSYAFQAGTGRLTQLSRPWVGDTVWTRIVAYTARGQLQSSSDNLLTAPTCTATGGTLLDGIVCTGASTPYKALAFQYDSAGNLTKQLDQLGGSDSLSATYAAGNRLQTIGGATYTYDADGNVATRAAGGITTYFTYDHQSQLISVRVGADTTFYGYNAAGRLVTRARNHNSGTTKRTLERVFFWDADHLLVETDSTLETRVAEYAYAPGVDRPLALLTPGAGGTNKIRYYHQDEVGNVIGLTDSTTVVQALEYRPWGDLAPSTLGTVGDTSRVRWKGLLWEEGKTQLYYVRNRWYDAVARRFLTEDPIGIEGGLNLYAFAANDPVNYSDPSGLCAEGESVEIVIYPDQWTKKCVARGGGIFFRGFFGGGQSGVSWGAFNAGLGFVPGLGDLQGGYEAVSGRSIGGGSLSASERTFSAAGAFVPFLSGSQLRVTSNALAHIFRTAAGHVNPVGLATQTRYLGLFASVASNLANSRPDLVFQNPAKALAGVQIFTQSFRRGQVWVEVLNGQIRNAGINRPGFFQ